MNMKNILSILCLAFTVLSNGCAFGQTNAWSYPWTATIKVVDEDANPVLGADVSVSYTLPPPPDRNPEEGGDGGEVKGVTDANGIFKASHTDSSWTLAIVAKKAGCYTTHIGHELYIPGQLDDKTVAASRNLTMTLMLKKIGRPIAMYARSVNLGVPVFDKPAGFDLMTGDWIAPYGKGTEADMIFEAHLDQRTESDADYKLTVSFPKPGDGIQEFTVPDAAKGSGLRSSHEAPADGYQSQWVQTRNRKPSQSEAGNFDANRTYIFRVRTVLDHQGNVVSARYGKIYGDFMQFGYYLNPTPNDRNIEFDPKQNLLGGLPFDAQVKAP